MAVGKQYDSNLIEYCLEHLIDILSNGSAEEAQASLGNRDKGHVIDVLVSAAQLICCKDGMANVSVERDCKLLVLV